MITIPQMLFAGLAAVGAPSHLPVTSEAHVAAWPGTRRHTIDIAMLRKLVRAVYPDLNVDSIDRRASGSVLVVLLFDADENLTRRTRIPRRTDRMFAIDVLKTALDSTLEMRDLDHAGIVPLTGPREGVVPGTVWVCWGKLRR